MSDYSRQAYLWISVALVLPVLLWPILLTSATPTAYAEIAQNWLLSAAALLLAAVIVDSVLAGAASMEAVLSSCIWILFAAALIPFISHAPRAGWILAMLFAIHALRSTLTIWRQQEQWWHWYAWGRDSATAAAMFLWVVFWPV